MRRAALPWIVVVSVSTAACGGGAALPSGDGGAVADAAVVPVDIAPDSLGLRTNIEGSKPLGSLTPGELDQLCTATKELTRALVTAESWKDFTCRVTGLAAVGFAYDDQVTSACQTAYDRCKAAQAPVTIPGTCGQPGATCTATVAEFEACVNELASTLATFDKLVPGCDKATKQAALGLLAIATQLGGPSCQTLDKKCPGAVSMPPRP